ncbi:hypothetical protein IQ07DRAFT_667503 [Pyrenochaeta sp. DS3sAY3a]|nr:hypothetical protein IQ07DRAFT_667503 [Pyrenochaeta sp. DS3sAY3a]
MTIFDDARAGRLLGPRIENWLRTDRSILNSKESGSGWTVLATAVVSGFPGQVEQLLEKGADATLRCDNNETPLLLATWETQVERPLMVNTLLSRIPENSEAVDQTCDRAGNITPLMWAIEKSDVECVRLLAKHGARQDIPNSLGLNAVQLAENTGNRKIIRALDPKEEQKDRAGIVSHVITIIRHIVSWVDTKFNGFMESVFGFKGERDEGSEQILTANRAAPEEPSPQEFVELVDNYVQNMPVLKAFFRGDRDFIRNMAQKTVDLANDVTTELGNPDLLPKTIQVTMHQQVIYCDDSASMVNENGTRERRWQNQKDLAARIAQITTRILPNGKGVALRFINQTAQDESLNLSLAEIEQGLNSAQARGNTAIGTTLRERILRPLVYEPLEAGRLERPLLISVLTDGAPSEKLEPPDTLAREILNCGQKLVENTPPLPKDSVKFLIGQIGSATAAVQFLKTLNDNPEIKNAPHIHIYAGRFDAEFASLRSDRKLDRWLVETLFKPLAAGAEALRGAQAQETD